MKYEKLAELYNNISSTTKRLKKTEILAQFLKNLSEDDRDVLYLLLGDIYPEYDERRIGISSQLAIRAISKATGINAKDVTKKWREIGDLGKVAEELTKKKRQHTLHRHILTTEKVLENLRKLPELEGKGSVDKKLALITELLSSATPIEALYLVRTLIGALRMGVKESTIRDAMAEAFFKEKNKATKDIQSAIDKSNDIASVFDIARHGKTVGFNKLHLEVGKPIKVMLAQKAKNIHDAFERVGKPAAVEYKYDGFRMLIHKKDDGKVILFTRRLENVTKQFPEVIGYVKKYVKGKSFIIDSEAVGYNRKTREYTPFQKISQRIRRKHNVEKLREELPVELNVFDILYYNGKSMLDVPFRKRTVLIRKIIQNHPYKIICAKQIITSSEKKAETFYKKALKDHQEGVMFKNLDARYQPGSRVGQMLKVKPEERDLDLVIVGGEYGTGKRSGWLSSFILACYDPDKKRYLEIGKVGTGIKEKATNESGGISFNELTERLKPHIISEKGRKVKIKPWQVIAVTYQEIERSTNYDSGFALRFPRFTVLRPDKGPKEANTLDDVKKSFENQKRNYRYG